ncbi:MAG: glycerol-3-phosphate dehydrogenase/oxidase [Candidatus Heimdallarchaeota archaeon]|nr:MAG: glycerol-3-phosphate dehydrogenase/oxidase [Candidatus Heimdallarchaeota archaeon]
MLDMETDVLQYRQESIENLQGKEFDILVIGGGITGAGIARDAVLRGYSVALVDKDDFGYGTSSGSSKMVHAGLRYTIQKEFRLVREGSVERKKILEMAPHLTHPIKFLIPLYSDLRTTKSGVRKLVWVYDLLAGFRNYTFHKILSPEKAFSILPKQIRKENFQGGALYGDGVMDDARLTLDVILSAEEHGAIVLNYCQATVFYEDSSSGRMTAVSVLDKLKNEVFQINTRAIVLACGHWTDNITRAVDPDVPQRIRPTKGIHIITKNFLPEYYALGLPIRDGRFFFAVPFGDNLLIGTTDTDYAEDYDFVPVTKEDIRYLIDAINFLFPGTLQEEDVISAYSGLRPLIMSSSEESESESDVSRKHEIFEIKPNVYAIAGGKYTTYRSMAEEMVDKLENLLGKKGKCQTDKVPLFGWALTKRKDWENWVTMAMENLTVRYQMPKDVVKHLMQYGTNYLKICKEMDLDPTLRERISKTRPYILAEITYQIKNEKAVTLNDVMFRRTQLQLSEKQGLDCMERVADQMATILGWSSVKKEDEITKYKESLVWKP